MAVRCGGLCALVSVAAVAHGSFAQLDVTTIARSGQDALALGGTWTNPQFRFDVNDGGRVAFSGLSSVPDAGGAASDGIFTFEPGTGLALGIRDDTTAVGGANYAGFGGVRVTNAGDLFYDGFLRNAQLGGTDVNPFSNEFLATSVSGIVAREGAPSDGGTTLPTPDGPIYLSDNTTANAVYGRVLVDDSGGFIVEPGFNTDAFFASDGTPAPSPFGTWWRQSASGDVSLALDPGETLLPGDLRIGFNIDIADMNDAGRVVFGVRVQNADGSKPNSTSDSGIYVQDPDGTITEVVRATGGTALDSIDDLESSAPKLDEAGNVFYSAPRRVNQDDRGLYTNIGGFTRVARLGFGIVIDDGMGGTEVALVEEFLDPIGFAVGREGEVAFRARVRETSFPNAERDAIFRWDNGTLTERFTEGDEVTGLPAGASLDLDLLFSSSDDRMEFNNVGTLGFLAQIGIGDNALIASLEDGTNIFIAGEGELFPFSDTEDKILTQITQWSLDDTNRVTLSAQFADGTAGLYSIVVPAPGSALVAGAGVLALVRRRR